MSHEQLIKDYQTLPYHQLLGLRVVSASEEGATICLPFLATNSNDGAMLHGGIAASLAIIVGKLAAIGTRKDAVLDDWDVNVIDHDIQYLSAVMSEEVDAVAKVLRAGKELVFTEVDVVKKDGQLVAKSLVTVRIVPKGADERKYSPPKLARDEFHAGDKDTGMFGKFGQGGFISHAGMSVEHAKDAKSMLNMPYREEVSDGCGNHHDGAIAALIDTSGALPPFSMVTPGAHRASTPAMHINFYEQTGGEDVTAVAVTRWQREELFVTDIEVIGDQTGTVYADGKVIYRIVIKK